MSYMNIPSREPLNLPLMQRIQELQKATKAKKIEIFPPLSVVEVEAFEKAHGIKIPEEYRLFVQHVCNGGGGPPDYGLMPLGEVPDADIGWDRHPFLAKPFPFTTMWIWESADDGTEGSQEQTEHGTLMLGTDGCGEYAVLVITGPQRGRVWIVAGVGIAPDEAHRDFLTWYEDWLATK